MQKLYESAIYNFIIRRITRMKVADTDETSRVKYIGDIIDVIKGMPVTEKTIVNLIGFLPMVDSVIYTFKTNTDVDIVETINTSINNANPNIEDKDMYDYLLKIWTMIVDYDTILLSRLPVCEDIYKDTVEEYLKVYTLAMIIDTLMSITLNILYTKDITEDIKLKYKKFFDWFKFNYELEYQEVLDKLKEVL